MKTLFCESYGMPWAPSRSAAKRHQTAQPDAELREAGAPGIRHPPAYPEGGPFCVACILPECSATRFLKPVNHLSFPMRVKPRERGR